MTRNRRRKKVTLSSTSSNEDSLSPFAKKQGIQVSSTDLTELMATAESDTGTPSLSDVWKVLMQIKANT